MEEHFAVFIKLIKFNCFFESFWDLYVIGVLGFWGFGVLGFWGIQGLIDASILRLHTL
jgi:hypothetical protein